MKTPTMLYKHPGQHEIHGSHFDTTIVDEDEIEDAMAKGWHLTTPDALAAAQAEEDEEEDRPASHVELKQKAAELGLTFAHNASKAVLAEMIAAALPKE